MGRAVWHRRIEGLALMAATFTSHPRWARRTQAVLIGPAALAWIAYWVTWYWAYNYTCDVRRVPAPLNSATDVALAVSAGASLLLAAGAIAFASLATARNPRA